VSGLGDGGAELRGGGGDGAGGGGGGAMETEGLAVG
jgi:hypothetical protein